MIEDIGKVLRITGDKAFVGVERTSACAQCGLQEVEELAGEKPIFVALNKGNADVGDTVKVRVQSVAYIKASAFIYGIPFLLLIIGAILGFYIAERLKWSSDAVSTLFGFCGLIIGILVLLLFRKRGTKKEYMPVITEVIKDNADA